MSEANKKPETAVKHDNIYAALSAFQGELKPIARTGTVEFPTSKGGMVKFNYTPLSEIMLAIYPLLAKHGLSVRHEIVKDEAKDAVIAIVTHETFFTERDEVKKTSLETGTPEIISQLRSINQIKSGPVRIAQGGEMKDTGAAITYARRYSLTMALGISSEDDKDAELLEQSAKNAIQFAFNRAKQGINGAKTNAELDKAVKVLRDDLAKLQDGKAPALGLSEEQYVDLLNQAEKVAKVLGEKPEK
jgi:hypothetical protein